MRRLYGVAPISCVSDHLLLKDKVEIQTSFSGMVVGLLFFGEILILVLNLVGLHRSLLLSCQYWSNLAPSIDESHIMSLHSLECIFDRLPPQVWVTCNV